MRDKIYGKHWEALVKTIRDPTVPTPVPPIRLHFPSPPLSMAGRKGEGLIPAQQTIASISDWEVTLGNLV